TLALCVVASLACVTSFIRMSDSRRRFDQLHEQLDSIQAEARHIRLLRQHRNQQALTAVPIHDLIEKVNDALSRVGIRSDALRSLTPESKTEILAGEAETSPIFKQTIRLVLKEVAPSDLGRFLQDWRTTQSVWTIGRIDLTHAHDQPERSIYDATLLIAALYVEDA
ncbi:MAG: hypothetical protein KJN63_03835, partial [Acidimicrobiia bacterium]|nr:hypothetical protein [Acidimicrobiia bacterium]